MRIINLVENTEGPMLCRAEHGLSFYIETSNHRVLMDAGASDLFAENAKRLGVDLSAVDEAVLSHGHYDHGGGFACFLRINDKAPVYVQKTAFGEYYSHHHAEDAPRYIGLSRTLYDFGRICFVEGNKRIDDELFLFSDIPYRVPSPSANADLMTRKGDTFSPDDFCHEQCLVVTEGTRRVLFSGCAHHGILNVMASFRDIFGADPDIAISGFHLMKDRPYTDGDVAELEKIALCLRETSTQFYTGHCTSLAGYEIMKRIMGGQLEYVHSGDEIHVP